MRPENEDYRGQSSRKYPRNVRRFLRRDQCFCGYLLGWRTGRPSISEERKCPDCRRKSGHVQFVNGVLVRQPA
jgi:hypothetical protein